MHKNTISRILAALLSLALAAGLGGCGKGESPKDTQSAAPQGENFDYTGYKDYSEDGLGFTLKLPGKYLDNQTIVPGKYEVMFGDLSQLDAPKAETDPSGHLDIYFMPQKGQHCLFRVLAYPA
jgi:hypothetical protein